MGCDIHLHGEVKIDGVWHCCSTPNIQRWYGLFAKMADVRNGFDIIPISTPKGFPDDASIVTKKNYEYWDCDAHSASWLSFDEIRQVHEWIVEMKEKKEPGVFSPVSNVWGYLFDNDWGLNMPKFIEDARFVFWFDN